MFPNRPQLFVRNHLTLADLSLSPLGIPAFLNPKIQLFLSVDIVGSTQFKQVLSHKGRVSQKATGTDEARPGAPWLSPILEFYEQFSSIFHTIWKRSASDAQQRLTWPIGEPPTIWKAVGDELIFTKQINDHREAYVCVAAWIETTQEYRKRQHFLTAGLDLKCAAWIAGFPINNAEVILYDSSNSDLSTCDDGDYVYGNLARLEHRANGKNVTALRDFIGPSIDTGFRVSSVASPRKFAITVDLAFMLAHAAGNLGTLAPPIKHLVFFYDGRTSLKGVTNGAPYPIFWVNGSETERFETIEDAIEKREAVPHSQVKDFCEHFLEKNKDTHVMRPFLYSDSDKTFNVIPPLHLEKLYTLANYFKNESVRRNNEQSMDMNENNSINEETEPDKLALNKVIAELASVTLNGNISKEELNKPSTEPA